MEVVGSINGKRPVTDDGPAAPKRIKGGNEERFGGDVKKVAEIVLVLAAMGKMRGGKGPCDVEKELMEAARNRLAKVCEGFAPKDVFPREAFGGMIEDLGLNKLKEQNLGLLPPKMSIAEKLVASMKKMEKAEEFAIPSSHSSRLPMNSGLAIESRSGFNSVRTHTSDKPIHVGHGTAANSTSLSYQLPTSEIKPMASSGTAMSRADRSHIRSDGRLNGASYNSQTPAKYPANTMVKTSTWSMQHHPNIGSDGKMALNMPMKNEGAISRAATAPSVGGMQSQGANAVQVSNLRNNHVEIGKVVQKLLQRVTERLTWDPPSRDYMHKPLTCQICMSMVTDIDSVLICDACEKGYHHLKCLGMKEIPRGLEWHCAKCLSLSNGKPLPPKYGRVMRNNNNSGKMSSSSETVPTTLSVKTGDSGEKISQPKAVVNGSIAPMRVPTGLSGNDVSHQISESVNEAQGMLESSKVSSGVLSVNPSVNRTSDGSEVDVKPNTSAEHVKLRDSSLEAGSIKESVDTHGMAMVSIETQVSNSSDNKNLLKDQEILQYNPSEIYSSAVKWIGDPIHVSEEKYYYTSCFINGHPYKAIDHVLVRFDNGKLIPAKIQAFWEDKNTSTKWVTVNRCYFPDDLPEAVGRPCGLENSEVCESTRDYECLASLIESPCQVLPPRKFAEECERRSRSVEQLNDNLPPLYLCKWIYDEAKGLFRDASF